MMNKQCPEHFAVLGGSPAFPAPLHVGCPNVGSLPAFLDHVRGIFDRRWFTNNGPLVVELERRLAAYLDVRNCVLTCNATIALQIAIRALGLRGEVILPSFTFVATAHALAWQGVTPVFCDIDPDTHNIDPREIEELITPRTSGIIGVHVWGRPCAVSEMMAIAERNHVMLLFDAAHAFGSALGGTKIGSFGNAEVFSFHATKFFNTFEGGAITTNNDALANRLRLMRNFGFVGPDQVEAIGTNGKMAEINAAMGLTLLENLDELLATNFSNYRAYETALADIPGLSLLKFDPANRSNYQYIVAEVDAPQFGLSRDRLVEVLHAENVLARRYFYPACHRFPPYSSRDGLVRRPLRVTDGLTSRVMTLPTGTAVTSEAIARVCSLIRDASRFANALRH